MKTNISKIVAAVSAVAMGTSAVVVGVSAPLTASAAGKTVTVKLWADSTEYKKVVKEFQKKNPTIKVKFQKMGSVDTTPALQKDPSTAADVMMVAHDQIGTLVGAKLVNRVSPSYEKNAKKTQVAGAVKGATYKGKMYGYAYGVETQVLYYNKSKLTADDVKSWDTLTSKGKIGVNFAEAGANYVWAPAFLTNGDVLFGKNGEKAKGTNFGNEKGVQVLKWVQAQTKNPGVIQTNAGALEDLSTGNIDAWMSGPWSKADAKKALGDNYAVAVYPKVNFGSGEKDLQAFLGVKLFVVNSATKQNAASQKLATYLTSDKVQKQIFNKVGYVPSSKKVAKSEAVKNDELASAVTKMSKISTPMPKIPEVNNFWTPMDAIFNDTWKGTITEDQMLPKLKAFDKEIATSNADKK
ncbi:MAG: extracellular solute-binding protein [Lactobacillaceae bacterium]|jgi:arabinogalactan oligomer/maltooligosaccharide transport system substrate-binding protein|nr:extracellular solute-binding protein [Lactobacillaceae bacterium]